MQGYRWLRFVPLVLPSVVSVAACDRPDFQLSDTAPVAGRGGSVSGTAGTPATEACLLDGSKGPSPVFSAQTVLNTSTVRREVYLYVDDAEAARLRSSGTLFPPAAPGTAGPTPAVVSLMNARLGTGSPEQRALITSLVPRFARPRSSWPNLWALRLVERPASQHMNPVRIVFREDSWFGRMTDKGPLVVVNRNNQPVSDSAASIEPEKVAAIFAAVTQQTGGAGCENGFREFSIPSDGMIESWSLGTADIVARLDADAQLLTELFGVVRSCPSVDKGGGSFHSAVSCSHWTAFSASTEYTNYAWALANPVELYKPSAQNLLGLVDALKSDRFEPEPFVVRPPRGGHGGTGGAGGTGAEGGMGGLAGDGAAGDSPGAAGFDTGAGGAP